MSNRLTNLSLTTRTTSMTRHLLNTTVLSTTYRGLRVITRIITMNTNTLLKGTRYFSLTRNLHSLRIRTNLRLLRLSTLPLRPKNTRGETRGNYTTRGRRRLRHHQIYAKRGTNMSANSMVGRVARRQRSTGLTLRKDQMTKGLPRKKNGRPSRRRRRQRNRRRLDRQLRRQVLQRRRHRNRHHPTPRLATRMNHRRHRRQPSLLSTRRRRRRVRQRINSRKMGMLNDHKANTGMRSTLRYRRPNNTTHRHPTLFTHPTSKTRHHARRSARGTCYYAIRRFQRGTQNNREAAFFPTGTCSEC